MTKVQGEDPAGSKAARTLRRIIEAGESEFSENGLDAGTMAGVAARAGTSQQLIYYYYRTKADLYQDILENVAKEMHQPFFDHDFDALNPIAAIVLFIQTEFAVTEALREKMTADMIAHQGDCIRTNGRMTKYGARISAILAGILSRGKADGLFRDDIAAKDLFFTSFLMVSGFLSSRHMMLNYFQYPGDTYSVSGWKQHAVQFILRGLVSEAGLAALPSFDQIADGPVPVS